MSGGLSQHHLSILLMSLSVHNHARVDVFTTTSFPSLSLIGIAGGTQQQPWNYLNEPVWSLNVKRGILSAMQNSMRDLAVSELVFKVQLEVLMFNSLKFNNSVPIWLQTDVVGH
jgi:hypothetical protein